MFNRSSLRGRKLGPFGLPIFTLLVVLVQITASCRGHELLVHTLEKFLFSEQKIDRKGQEEG